jgi:hypothetical protein
MLDTKAFSRSKGVGFQLHELTPGKADKSSVLPAKAATNDRFA